MMRSRIIKCERPVVVRPALRQVSRVSQGSTHEAMADHERHCRTLHLGEREELCREFAHCIAVKGHAACGPKTVEDGEQKQLIFGGLVAFFSLLDQQKGLLCSRLGFQCSIAFDVEQWVDKRDLKFDLLTTQRGGGGKSGDLVEGTTKLFDCFDQRRTSQ